VRVRVRDHELDRCAGLGANRVGEHFFYGVPNRTWIGGSAHSFGSLQPWIHFTSRLPAVGRESDAGRVSCAEDTQATSTTAISDEAKP
jgi:hypothetical protein